MKKLLFSVAVIMLGLACSKEDSEKAEPVFDNPQDRVHHELMRQGYEMAIASDGAAYVPGQFLIDVSTMTAAQKSAISDSLAQFGVVRRLDDCGCTGFFELWEVDSLKSNENEKSGKSKVAEAIGHEESTVTENVYMLPDHVSNASSSGTPFNMLDGGFSVQDGASIDQRTVIIALLDTGVDLDYQDELSQGRRAIPLWENGNERDLDGEDDQADPMCLIDDLVGWDFVNDDNSPMDDHSHGTHIASNIEKNMAMYYSDVDYRIMPLKILDESGVGTLSDALCAIVYASVHQADIISASWGYYGEERKVLRNVMRTASTVFKINHLTSIGNDGEDMVALGHYPSAFAYDLAAVGTGAALDSDGSTLLSTSNYSENAFIAGPGRDLEGLIPHHLIGKVSPMKTGTSITVATGVALTANLRHHFPGTLNPGFKPKNIRELAGRLASEQIAPQRIEKDGKMITYFPLTHLVYP